MSAIALTLEARALPALPAAAAPTLHALRKGSTATITGFVEQLEPSTARRLFDLGLTPGAQVEVVRRAPVLDPTIYRVAGCEVALRRELARGILVETATDPR
ncbi:FeoA family protein [Calidifontibacter terrae]